MATPQNRGVTATLVAVLLVGGAFALDLYALVNGLPKADGSSHDAVIMILTAWNSMAALVGGYFYGNSANSDRKTELLAQTPATGATVEVKADTTTVTAGAGGQA
jgi:hypothetical protein